MGWRSGKNARSNVCLVCLQLLPINTPEDMVAALLATPHSIGFAPTPEGVEAGLAEVALPNAAGSPVAASSAGPGDLAASFTVGLPGGRMAGWAGGGGAR